MARMFTKKHREIHGLPVDHPKFHGEDCESVYVTGMELLEEHHYLRSLLTHINLITRIGVDLGNKQARKNYRIWEKAIAALENEPRTHEAIKHRYNEVAEMIKDMRCMYTEYHNDHHGLPAQYHVVDPRMVVIKKCHSHQWATRFIERKGGIYKIKYVKE